MKYIVNQGKSNEHSIIVFEKMRRAEQGRISETILCNKETAVSFRVTVDYEKVDDKEVILNLRVEQLNKDFNIGITNVIQNACLHIVNLVRVNKDVLPYVIQKLYENYPYCSRALYQELEDDYYEWLIAGNDGRSVDIKALKSMEELLTYKECKNCEYIGYFDEREPEVITGPLKSYEELGIHLSSKISK